MIGQHLVRQRDPHLIGRRLGDLVGVDAVEVLARRIRIGIADGLVARPTRQVAAAQTALEISNGAKVQAVILSYTAFDLLQSAKGGFETAQNPFWKWGNASPRGLFGAGISVESHEQYYKAVSPLYLLPEAGYKLPPQFVLVGSKDGLTTPEVASGYVSLQKAAGQQVEFKIYEGKGHGFLDSGCNDYTHGCFKDLATPTLDDMIKFLDSVFN